MLRTGQLSNRDARWLAIEAQGLGGHRTGRPGVPATRARVRGLLDQVGTIQLDAVNVVARTQFLVPFSRLGHYDPAHLRSLTGPGKPWFEYWGHAASLMPTESYPLFRWRMERWRDDRVDSLPQQQRRREWRAVHADYLAAVLADVAGRGPLTAAQLADPRRRVGEWWERRSVGRQALELLFGDGALAAWRGPNFERVYDLTERVIPAAVLDRPVPDDEDAQRELMVWAARCLGVATVADMADYFGMRPAPSRLRVAELVEEGRLAPVTVEGWDQPGYVLPDVRLRRPRADHAALLSPFDSLIWTRERTMRLFDVHFRIEIYVPEHLRTYGYYVLPLLLGDAIVARFDLKADRPAGALRVRGAYLEPDADAEVDAGAVAEAAAGALRRMGAWLGLGQIVVDLRGSLAADLASAMAGSGAGGG